MNREFIFSIVTSACLGIYSIYDKRFKRNFTFFDHKENFIVVIINMIKNMTYKIHIFYFNVNIL